MAVTQSTVSDEELGKQLKWHMAEVKRTMNLIYKRGYECQYQSAWTDGFNTPVDILDGTDISCAKYITQQLPGMEKKHVKLVGKSK